MDAVTAEELLELAEALVPRLRGLDREQAFAQIEQRYDKLLEALAWFVDEGRADEAIALARALAPFWQATRRLEQSSEWFEQALGLEGGDDGRRGRALVEAGFVWFLRGDDERATALYRRAQELGLAAPTVAALALAGLARIALRRDDLDEARRLCLEAIALSEADVDPAGRGSAAHVLGVTAQMAGEFEEARHWLNVRIESARLDGNYDVLGLEASNLAMVERQLGELDRAEELLREALEIFRRRRDEWAYSFALNGLAAVDLERGEHERAAKLIGAADARVEEQGAT